MARIKHRSAQVPLKAVHTVGVVAGGALHLHPLTSMQQLRPDMGFLDPQPELPSPSAAASSSSSSSAAGGQQSVSKVGPQFRRVEDKAAQMARRSTWTYLQVRAYPLALLRSELTGKCVPDSYYYLS